ncbi:hypothetical protein [Sinosporangium album]|uniref:hypothetical protein n=1 Tax=Sinosporangium album TaxID=504805 RepID=UPI00115FF20E|nr:hypothetical protein [Sinosporangium album]
MDLVDLVGSWTLWPSAWSPRAASSSSPPGRRVLVASRSAVGSRRWEAAEQPEEPAWRHRPTQISIGPLAALLLIAVEVT